MTDWWQTLEVNLRTPYLITRYLIDAMPKGSKIINVTSGKDFQAGQNSSSYNVSKAGLSMFSHCLANELWQRQIDVNLLAPGLVATTTLSRQDPNSGVTTCDILRAYTEKTPANLLPWEKVKHPEEIAT